MKQHITVEQVIENTYIYDQLGVMYCKEKNDCTYMAKDISEWLNIGQMIELLSYTAERQGEIPEITCNHLEGRIYIDVDLWGKKEYFKTNNYQNKTECKELADALWEAIKSIL
jgi:hypothetical protein